MSQLDFPQTLLCCSRNTSYRSCLKTCEIYEFDHAHVASGLNWRVKLHQNQPSIFIVRRLFVGYQTTYIFLSVSAKVNEAREKKLREEKRLEMENEKLRNVPKSKKIKARSSRSQPRTTAPDRSVVHEKSASTDHRVSRSDKDSSAVHKDARHGGRQKVHKEVDQKHGRHNVAASSDPRDLRHQKDSRHQKDPRHQKESSSHTSARLKDARPDNFLSSSKNIPKDARCDRLAPAKDPGHDRVATAGQKNVKQGKDAVNSNVLRVGSGCNKVPSKNTTTLHNLVCVKIFCFLIICFFPCLVSVLKGSL